MTRYQTSSARQQSRSFATRVEVQLGWNADQRRINDLILAGVIGWQWPQYYMQAHNLHQRIGEILDATDNEVLPWAM